MPINAASDQRSKVLTATAQRASALFQKGDYHSADVLLSSVADEPEVKPFVRHMRGLIAWRLGDRDKARQLIGEALALNPADAEAHANLGSLLLEDHRFADAAAAYEAALTLRPARADSLVGLAKALAELGLFDLAIDSYRDALAYEPDYLTAQVDLAALLGDAGDTSAAIAAFQGALARRPEQANLHTMLAFCLLATGDWRSAWPEYEWRWRDPHFRAPELPAKQPRWQGEDLTGRTILLQCEQGFGDTLQFVRYVPMVKASGGRVLLRAPKPLLPLLQNFPGIDELHANEDGAPPCDVYAPLLSLPGLFGTEPGTVPNDIPYLHADRALVGTWRARLAPRTGLSVGLCWQGNPAHLSDHQRSIRLEMLRPLLDGPGIRFVSLQVGPGQEQLEPLRDRIIDPFAPNTAPTFADTAAIIADLDLVITIDSAIAHLAGAMGKPVWILLAARNDWRWMRERTDTPWYPQARLFRQETLGTWAEVVMQVRQALWRLAQMPLTEASVVPTTPAAGTNPTLCDALFVQGVRHHRANNLDRSMKSFKRVLMLDPDHVNTLCNLGALQVQRGEHAKALALLERAVALAPTLVPARLALAGGWLATGEADKALAHYRTALDIAPDSDAVHAGLAMALRAAGDLDGALVHFERAAQINRAQPAEFYAALGLTLVALGRFPGATISLTHAVALDPNRLDAHCGLGAIGLETGQPGEAASRFRTALRIDPACAAAIHGLQQATRHDGPAADLQPAPFH